MLRGLRRQAASEGLNTIIHGELWERNILFRPADGRCTLLDWKNAKVAAATLDLAFLLFSSCSGEAVVRHRAAALERYRAAHEAALARLAPACAAPTAEELEADFALSLKDALLQAICMFVQEMEYLEVGGCKRIVQ